MDFLSLLHSLSTGDIALIVFALLSIVQISPIKIDPWSCLLRWFGKAINGGDMIDRLEEMMDQATTEREREAIRRCMESM